MHPTNARGSRCQPHQQPTSLPTAAPTPAQQEDNSDGATQRVSTDSVMIDPVVGAKRFSNYFWAGVVTTGSTGFLITGLSAYFHHNLLFFLDASDIKFFPQGLVMSFYGVLIIGGVFWEYTGAVFQTVVTVIFLSLLTLFLGLQPGNHFSANLKVISKGGRCILKV